MSDYQKRPATTVYEEYTDGGFGTVRTFQYEGCTYYVIERVCVNCGWTCRTAHPVGTERPGRVTCPTCQTDYAKPVVRGKIQGSSGVL